MPTADSDDCSPSAMGVNKPTGASSVVTIVNVEIARINKASHDFKVIFCGKRSTAIIATSI
ncbi:hypothetical protein EAG21025_00410 [Enterobacter asburiae]|nr:hypothetical protein EAI6_35490 [Enterobacter asburiae]